MLYLEQQRLLPEHLASGEHTSWGIFQSTVNQVVDGLRRFLRLKVEPNILLVFSATVLQKNYFTGLLDCLSSPNIVCVQIFACS